MFKITHKYFILRSITLSATVALSIATATAFIVNSISGANAAHNKGDTVQITKGPVIWYTDNEGVEGWSPRYKVKVDGKNEDAYCVQPQAHVTDDEVTTTVTNIDSLGHDLEHNEESWTKQERVNMMKLTMFIAQTKGDNFQVARTAVFGPFQTDGGSLTDSTIYVFAHAILSVLYGKGRPDQYYSGLGERNKQRVKDAIVQVKKYIDDNKPVWQAAQDYKMYLARMKDVQDIVWIEYNKPTGSITVQKCDAEITSACIPQGNGNFDGITFNLYNGATLVASQTLANGAQSVTFTDLDTDVTYTITESGSNTSYDLTAAPQTAQPTVAGVTLTFNNTIKRGSLTVHKVDKDTGTCTNSNGLSFAGTTFQLVNTSARSISYNGAIIASGGVVTTKTLADGECSFIIGSLPYGTYSLQETSVPAGYALDNTPKPITIPTGNEYQIAYTFENQPIRGDITFLKKDTNNNAPMANAVFEISSISGNHTENHIVVADANGIVSTEASINPHTNHTNGYDELYYSSEAPIAYAGYGTWFGKDKNGNPVPAKDNVGALPYGSYLIQELKCDTNMFCTSLNNEKKVFNITTNGQVVNLNDAGSDSWGNNCAEFSLGTTATDNSDGDHYIELGQKEAVIKDVIAYCAKKNYTFTIKGILMDKATNQPLLVNGETVERSVEISPENDCGTVEMLFPLDTTDLVGKSIVVFEKLYYKNEEKASHEEINDPGQTIDIVSLGTTATDNSDGDKLIVPGEDTVIKDTVSYCAAAGQPYTIVGTLIDKTTREPILINGEPVIQSISFTSTENCGTVDIVFPAIDTTTITGHPIVVYETLYKVTPGEPGQPDTLEPVVSHENPEDEGQTVYVIDLYTTVKPNADGNKIFPNNADITVADTVHYCLQPGLEYTVKGIIMDRSTGNGLLVNGTPVESSVTFTPTESCGNIDMAFNFNTTGLSGAKLVIFESLYYNDELLIEHKDIGNELESFEIDITPPETGYITKAKASAGGAHESQNILVIGLASSIGTMIAYAIIRHKARRGFYNR